MVSELCSMSGNSVSRPQKIIYQAQIFLSVKLQVWSVLMTIIILQKYLYKKQTVLQKNFVKPASHLKPFELALLFFSFQFI